MPKFVINTKPYYAELFSEWVLSRRFTLMGLLLKGYLRGGKGQKVVAKRIKKLSEPLSFQLLYHLPLNVLPIPTT